MRKAQAAAGSLIFLLLTPGVVVGLVPWWITGWRSRESSLDMIALRLLGGGLLLVGLAVLLHAFLRFVVEGLGTPAPVAPTADLVVGGPYRFVRNPMYLAVLSTLIGQALLLGQVALLWYAAAVAFAQAAFVHLYEEPLLRSRFGHQYEEYSTAVPAWLPRFSPWRAGRSTSVEASSRPGEIGHTASVLETSGQSAGVEATKQRVRPRVLGQPLW
jgi:protein-S-isoprenylcysteine O-methyltransferase Ste14